MISRKYGHRVFKAIRRMFVLWHRRFDLGEAYYRRALLRARIDLLKPHGRKRGRPPKLDHAAYRRRNVVERCIGWLKICRRIATRSEKLAVHFLAMVKLAMIQRRLRVIDEP